MKIRELEVKDKKQVKNLIFNLFSKWDDLDEIDMINKEWFNSKEFDLYFNKILINDNIKFLVLELEDNIVSYIKGEILLREPFLKKVGNISEIYTLEEVREKGYGKKLFNELILWFKKNNLDWFVVSTHSLDEEAISFWENKGFKEYNKYFKLKNN